MTDQGVAKEQYITVDSLKEIADPAKKFLKKGTRRGYKQKELKFRAKVVNQQLADQTGYINYHTEQDIKVQNNQTYEFTGVLKVVNYKLSLNITSATAQGDQITNLGSEQFSSADIDQYSAKHIIQLKDIIHVRMGQSFFARPTEITHNSEERRAKATLADATAAIEAEISVNKKSITQEVLESLKSDKVYLFSDVVLDFNENNKLVGRFNYRSNIVEVNERQIQQISNNNLSAKEYSDESEKNALIEILQINEKKERVHNKQQNKNKNPRNAHKNHNRQRPNFQETEPVKISDLQQWNNNQTVIGKIVTLNVENKPLPSKEDGTQSNMVYLKGTIGDETGVIDFDMAEKRDTPRFKVGDVVKFTTVMNKGRQNNEGKVGGHYIEVKKFGQYIILSDRTIDNVNLNHNLSNLELTARPKNLNPRFIRGEFIGVQKEEKNGNTLYTYTVRNQQGEEESLTIKNNITKHKVGEQATISREIRRQNSRNHQSGQKTSQSLNNKGQHINIEKLYNNQNNQNKQFNKNNSNNNENRNNQRSQSNQKRRYKSNENRQVEEGRGYRNNRERSDNINNNNKNNNNNRDNGNGYRNNSQNNQRYRNNSLPPRNNQNISYTDISGLEPGKRGQNVTGQVRINLKLNHQLMHLNNSKKVTEASVFSKQIGDRNLRFVKGRIADAKANIRFDIKKPNNLDINVGEVYTFINVNNKVDDNGFHYIDLNRFGKVFHSKWKFQSINNQRNVDADRSSIEYVKKTVPN
ncbi:hypothetical protein ABPG72_008020 [Tetrahymena utriculariae]